jgi:hypothetical protein
MTPAFPRRPESIFDGVEMPVAILVSRPQTGAIFTSRAGRFYTEERPAALRTISVIEHKIRLNGHRIGKLSVRTELNILEKVQNAGLQLESLARPSRHILYYQDACRYWMKACNGYPFFRRNGERMQPPHGRTISFASDNACAFATCLVNSSLFYWFYSLFSDCEHVNDSLIRAFPVPEAWKDFDWTGHEKNISRDLKEHSQRKVIRTKQGHVIEYDELDAAKSKAMLDRIDHTVAKLYRFSEEEFDFVTNYDIKYRLGASADSDSEAA